MALTTWLDDLLLAFKRVRQGGQTMPVKQYLEIGAGLTATPSGDAIILTGSGGVPSTATPVQVATTGDAGISTDFSRGDHQHAIGEGTIRSALASSSGSLAINSQRITSLGSPVASTDAATKAYVDAAAGGALSVKWDIDLAAQASQSLTSGVNVTLTDGDGRSMSVRYTDYMTSGTSAGAIVNGSGVELTCAGVNAGADFSGSLSQIGRTFMEGRYRATFRWGSYAPLGATNNLFTVVALKPQYGWPPVQPAADFVRRNTYGIYSNMPNSPATSVIGGDVFSIEMCCGVVTLRVGTWNGGWPAISAMKVIWCVAVPPNVYGLPSLDPSYNGGMTTEDSNWSALFYNYVDSTSRTMVLKNIKIEA